MTYPVWLAFAAAFTLRGAMAAEPGAPEQPRPPSAISPHVRAILRANTPSYQPVSAASAASEAPADKTAPDNDPGVVRMPKYFVQESKLPKPADVMTRRALEEMAMNKYLGSRDGLDRGFLNRFTIPGLLRKIPIIGPYLPSIGMTNEERAMSRYYEDERLRKMGDLMDLSTITTRSGDRELGERIKRETQDTFRR
ncbi:MAG TPA: hypothetical protein VM029_22230 [Opitutaceae bacterium]|nr:hypothetical protein [Opitutaceae bacterium]